MPFQLSCLAVNSTRWYVLDSSLPLSKCLKKKKSNKTDSHCAPGLQYVLWNCFNQSQNSHLTSYPSGFLLSERRGKKYINMNMPSYNSINCEIIWKLSPCYFRYGPPFWRRVNRWMQTVNVTCKWMWGTWGGLQGLSIFFLIGPREENVLIVFSEDIVQDDFWFFFSPSWASGSKQAVFQRDSMRIITSKVLFRFVKSSVALRCYLWLSDNAA